MARRLAARRGVLTLLVLVSAGSDGNRPAQTPPAGPTAENLAVTGRNKGIQFLAREDHATLGQVVN